MADVSINRLAAPCCPRRHRIVRRAVRADRIRRWLSFGPSSRAELVHAMQCSRFALHHTLRTMPDVVTRDGQYVLNLVCAEAHHG